MAAGLLSTHPKDVEEVLEGLRRERYVAGRGLATTLYLGLVMARPVFLEGEAGVGKTEVAKVLARMLGTRLIRMQCYEGLDVHDAVYEWDYARQILQIRLLEATGATDRARMRDEIFGREYLVKRPLLEAIEPGDGPPPVLLIDELDRADEEFEAFLLEILSDFQITIPELGTIRAEAPPVVVVTSNRTREVHDALKRRCLYAWIDYPSLEKELEIVRTKVGGIGEGLARQVVRFVQELRGMELYKLPGVSETLDWAAALLALSRAELTEGVVDETLGVVLKYEDDLARVRGKEASRLVARARAMEEE